MIVALVLIRPARADAAREHRAAPRASPTGSAMSAGTARPRRDLRDGVPRRGVRHELPDLRLDDGARVRTGRRRLRPAQLDPRDRLARRRTPGRTSRPRRAARGHRRHAAVRGRRRRLIVHAAYWTYAATLMFTGFAIVTMLTTANGYVQTTTDPALRGRVLALYMAILMGGTPIGAPIVGWVAADFGPRTAILVGARPRLVAFAIGAMWLLASGRLHRDEDHGGSASRSTRPCRSGGRAGARRSTATRSPRRRRYACPSPSPCAAPAEPRRGRVHDLAPSARLIGEPESAHSARTRALDTQRAGLSAPRDPRSEVRVHEAAPGVEALEHRARIGQTGVHPRDRGGVEQCSLPQCGRAANGASARSIRGSTARTPASVVVPREVDREEVPLVRAAQPQIVGCRRAQLADEQLRADVVGASSRTARRAAGASERGTKYSRLDLVAERRRSVQAEVRQALHPRPRNSALHGQLSARPSSGSASDDASRPLQQRHRPPCRRRASRRVFTQTSPSMLGVPTA